jgi:hypothetical protein
MALIIPGIKQQTLKISQMKPMWSYEHPLPTFKVPLKATPRSIVYDGENEALVVMVSSTVKDNTRYLRPPADDKKDDERARDMKERGIDPDSIKYNESDGMEYSSPAAYINDADVDYCSRSANACGLRGELRDPYNLPGDLGNA